MASLDGISSSARARRRPTRYSPDLTTTVQQQPASEMCFTNGIIITNEQLQSADIDITPEAAAAVVVQLQEEIVHDQEHLENAVAAAAAATTTAGEMAPALNTPVVTPPTNNKRTRHNKPKRKYNKRKTLNEDGTKRQRVANVLLENEMLIDEIRTRKALWMRTHEQHHSAVLTAPLWEEIAKVLDTTQESIRRRWKSLKDHYRRELKKSMTDPTASPSVWPYYKKMRFMKSQMFVSLRRKNGEDHLEILSDDEEDVNCGWNGQGARKQEGSDTMDDYELGDEYHELVKFEQQLQQLPQDDMDATQEELEEEDETTQHPPEEEQEEQIEQQEEMSPNHDIQDQEELEEQEISEQPAMTSDMSTMTTMGEMVGMPAIVTTTASSLSNIQQHVVQQRASDLNSSITEQQSMNEEIARQSAIQQQRADINNRISAIQRTAEMSAIQQQANISALHERAEMTAMQQRAEMQQRTNGDNSNGVSPIIGDDRGGISDDYHFFMSLMPHVKNFSSLQKLKVRNRIQQIIIEEASNCQYDPLGNC